MDVCMYHTHTHTHMHMRFIYYKELAYMIMEAHESTQNLQYRPGWKPRKANDADEVQRQSDSILENYPKKF